MRLGLGDVVDLGEGDAGSSSDSGFVKPTGEMYGEVVNAQGESWTGLGAPELPRIAALVKFRREHAAEIASDPAVAKKVQDKIDAIDALRREAGITGQTTQPVYIDARRTLYSRTGDVLPWGLVIFTCAGLIAQLLQVMRRRVTAA